MKIRLVSNLNNEIKIGMYTTDEILKFMTNGEGRGFMGRSMYDAIIDYITNLQEENKELKKKITFNEKSRRKMQQSLMEQIETYKQKNKEIYDGFIATQEELSDYATRNEKYEKVINEIKEKIDDYFGYDYENENQARLDTINEINHIIVDLYNGGDEEC